MPTDRRVILLGPHIFQRITLLMPDGARHDVMAELSDLAKALRPGERWITVRPNGPGTKGQPVLVREEKGGVYRVIGGAGGSLNFLRIRGVRSEHDYKQEAAERQKAKRDVARQQRERDKELGVHEIKTAAKKAVKDQQQEQERTFIRTVAAAMGWEGHEFDPTPTLNLSEQAQKKAVQQHHREWLKKATNAVEAQRERLLTDAEARAEVLGEIPLETARPDVLSVQDLAPIKESNGLGFATNYKERAEAAGATKEVVEAEKAELDAQRPEEQREAIAKRKATAERVAEELKAIRDPGPKDAKTKLVDAKQAVELLKAQKQLKAIQAKAREAAKDIDKSIEPKAYVLEVGKEALDEAVQEDLENDLRTIKTRAFLSEVGKVADYEHTLGRHIGVGAYNAVNALALTAAGAGLVDRSVVDVLGVAGAAQVLTRRLHTDLTADELSDVQHALEAYHTDHYLKASEDALREAMEWQDVAKGIDVGTAVDGHDLMRAQEMNAKRREAVQNAYRIMGTTLGEMEANAAMVMALKQGRRDTPLQVSLGDVSAEDAIRQARAIGLERGDYQIESVGANRFLTVMPQGLDRLSKPVNREDLQKLRGALDIIEGRQDEDNWLPKGMANRPDLAMHVEPGAAPRLAEPFTPGEDLEQSIRDYIGGRTADGEPPADIVADLLSQDVVEKVGDRDAYFAVLDKIAPLKDEQGKPIRAESHQEAFEGMADAFVQSRYGGARDPLHRQSFPVDQVSVDALHRALADEPAGVLAYRPVGDLTPQDQRALRDFFAQHVAKDDGRTAQLRGELDELDRSEPAREVEDMFGRGANPEWADWKARRDAKAEELNAAGLNWGKYVKVMGKPAKAYAAMQDLVRSKVAKAFHEAHNTLRPDQPLKLGRTVIAGNLNHLDAVDPDARERRLAEHRQLVDSLRERIAGRYASGSVKDKLERTREAMEALDQAQMGFFAAADDHSADAGKVIPLAADERHTLGHAAERQLAGMMPIVGQNFRAGKPVRLWQPSMNGKYINQQRAVKLIDRNKRVVLAQGVGCVDGSTILDDAENRGWTFAQWLESGESPLVFSKVGDAIEVVRASPVFTKGMDEMFQVALENGSSITVTAQHRFLTDAGWRYLSDLGPGDAIVCTADSAPLRSVASHLPSSLEHGQSIHPLNGRRLSHIAQDFPDDCFRGPRPYDEQLRLEADAAQGSVPLQDGVHEHSHCCLLQDDQVGTQERSRIYQRSFLRSIHGFCCRTMRHVADAVFRFESSPSGQTQQRRQAHPLSRPCSFLSPHRVVANRQHRSGRGSWYAWFVRGLQERLTHFPRFVSKCQDVSRSRLGIDIPDTREGLDHKEQAVFRPSRISSVVSIGYRLVYDLSVPLSENYIAHGIVNHNSGKTVIGLAGFTHAHAHGKAKRGLFIVPSIVQGQFSGEALRYLEPGKYKWHIEPGASREERLAAYRDPETHFSVVTHQSFRDDLLHLGAKQAGVSEEEMAQRVDTMSPHERKAWMRGVMDGAGMDHDYLFVDEGHDLLNRAGKENSMLANVIDSVAHNTPYYVNASADPVKNDPSEIFDILHKMDPERYSDQKAFMRRYGVDTPSSRAELQRELARYFYPGKIDSGVKADKKEISVPLSDAQRQAIDAMEHAAAQARLARMRGAVDVEAMKTLSPSSFTHSDPAHHEAIAKRLQQNLGIIKQSAVQRAIDAHEASAKIDHLAQLAHERRGKPGVVFARSLDAVRQVAERLKKEGHRVITLTGHNSAKEKEAIKLAFNPEKGEAKADILVASDAGAVGLNAQRGQWLVQYDSPATAKTHAQRNGRIDRLGQKNNVELMDLVADHPVERKNRKRLAEKYDLRGILTTPLEGLDDTGLAAYLNQARMEREQQNGSLF